jgi:hypothetical protein
VGDIPKPHELIECFNVAPNAKSKAEKKVFNLGFAGREKW